MPLYEGIGLISEKHAVVLDIGADTTKCGYAGDVTPRCMIPSKVGDTWVHSAKDPDKLYALLVDFVHHLYFKWLLVNPKDRRVVIVENLLGVSLFKNTIAKVLFNHYEVSSILFVPSHLVSLFSLGINTGLVLDVGHQEATVLPVYEGVPILSSWQAHNSAGHAVQEAVKADLICRGKVASDTSDDASKDIGDYVDSITDELVRDITLKCCFITNITRGKHLQEMMESKSDTENKISNPAPVVKYPLSGAMFLRVDGVTREGCAELLWSFDNDCISVASIILEAISCSPVDCRKQLADNLIIIGGTSMMKGFYSRLNQELLSLLATPKYEHLKISNFKCHKLPGKANYSAWLGGAIFGATDVVITRSLTREQYLKDHEVPDWSNLKFNSVTASAAQG